MPRILVFQHAPSEVLGTLDPLLKARGFRIKYANFGRFPDQLVSCVGYAGLVVLGGPQNVGETQRYPHLKHEMDVIGDALRCDIPVLGICLGAQLVAHVLGAEVYPNAHKEIGWYDVEPTVAGRADSLLGHLGAVEKIFQWHGYTFRLPHGAVHLARSSVCENQAFRYFERVYGFQFHLEVDSRMVERWLNVPHNRQELAGLSGTVDPMAIRAATMLYAARQKELGDAVFGKFIALMGAGKKFRRLESR